MQPHILEGYICGTWWLGSYWLKRDRQQRDVAEERKWKMDRKDEWGWGVSSTIAASCPEKSIHHFHVFVSWLTLAIARSVAMMTCRIDEVQAGVASRGLGWRWSIQMCEVGPGWTTRGTRWRSWCHPLPSLTISICRHTLMQATYKAWTVYSGAYSSKSSKTQVSTCQHTGTHYRDVDTDLQEFMTLQPYHKDNILYNV